MTLLEKAKGMRVDVGLSKGFWLEVAHSKNYHVAPFWVVRCHRRIRVGKSLCIIS
jgi:hypothetical protein